MARTRTLLRDELIGVLVADGILDDVYADAQAEGAGTSPNAPRDVEDDAAHIIDLLLKHVADVEADYAHVAVLIHRALIDDTTVSDRQLGELMADLLITEARRQLDLDTRRTA